MPTPATTPSSPRGSCAAPKASRSRAGAKLKRGLRPELHVFLDHTSDVPYAEPDDDSPAVLWLLLRHRTIMRLGDASFLLKELRNKRLTSSRLIFPSELRTDIEATLGPLLDEFA